MIKRTNQYLVTHHPQIWNTKLVWVLGASFITHIIFYIAGYLHFDDFAKLHQYTRIDNNFVESTNVGFAALMSFLILIIWLVFYLRNNPFKSLYPLKKSYFIAEFAIIALVVASSVTFYKTYALGFCQAVKNKTADIDLVEQINTYNLAKAFIPEDAADYKIHSVCDSIDYIDSLNSLNRTIWDAESESFVYDSTKAYIDTLIKQFNRRKLEDANLSILHYCQKSHFIYNNNIDSLTYSKYEISNQVQQLLTTSNKQKVSKLLADLEGMCKLYKVDYNIVIAAYADYAFASSKHIPVNFVNRKYVDEEDVVYNSREKYNEKSIEFEELTTSLDNINRVRTFTFDYEFWLINLYFIIGLSIVLFTFRLTPIRVWFTAIAAHLGLPIIVALLAALLNGSSMATMILLEIIVAAALIMHFVLRNSMKKTSGVFLVWFTWWFMFIGFLICAQLLYIYQPEYVPNGHGGSTMVSNPVYDFITDYKLELAFANTVVSFFVIGLVLSRLYRKWMALPDE